MVQRMIELIQEWLYSAASEDYFLEFLHKNDNMKNHAKCQRSLYEHKREPPFHIHV